MKTFRGKIVAADVAERTITVHIQEFNGASGAVMGEEVTITSVQKKTLVTLAQLDTDYHKHMDEACGSRPPRIPGE